MTAGKYNMLIEQGATFSLPITWRDSALTPVDNSAYTARAKIRKTPLGPEVLVFTTENGRITLGGADGVITLAMPADETEDLIAGEYVYDLEMVNGGSVTRLIEGRCTIRQEVTW